jgi:hypothetical protein
MSSLDNGLPRFDRLDLSPTKWEPDTAIARAPTPTKPIISKPSRKIPLRVPSKNVRDVDLDGIIAPHNVGEAPTPRVVIDEKKTFTKPYNGFESAVDEVLVVANDSGEEAELWLSRDDNDQALKVLYLQPRSRKRVKLRSGQLEDESDTPGDFTVALTTASSVYGDSDDSDCELPPSPPRKKEEPRARFSTAEPMGLELEGKKDGSIVIHKVHAGSQASQYEWMRAGLRLVGFENIDDFQECYFEARDNGEDVELLFEEEPENNATATFLTGTNDVVAARVPPARPVRAPDNLGKALQAPPDEVARACAVCIRNATGRRLMLYAGTSGGTLKRRATIDAHDATLCQATTAELWLAAFEDAEGHEPALTLRLGPRAVFNVVRSYSLVWRASVNSLSFVPRATAIQVPARKFRRDYASERATMHLRAMDEVRAARAAGEGHANCVVTVLE